MPIILRNVGAVPGDSRDRVLKNLTTPPLVSTAPGRRGGFRGALGGGGGEEDPVDTTPITDWQLEFSAFDYAYGAEIVAPRPMAELTSNSAYLWGHPDFDYVRCFHARGGAWPYHWEVVSGPTGTTIGEFLEENEDGEWVFDAQEYSVLRVPKQPEGTVSTIVVRMRDQNWNRGPDPSNEFLIEIDITWQADKWVFLSPNGVASAAGDVNNPLDLEWFINNRSNFPGKLAYFRGGTYADVQKRFEISPSDPIGWLAVPNEVPSLQGMRVNVDGSAHDLYMQGLSFDKNYSDYTHYYFFIWPGIERSSFFLNTFANLTPGDLDGDPDGYDNSSAIFSASSTSKTNQYLAIARNHFVGFRGHTNPNHGSMTLYMTDRGVIEMNQVTDCEAGEVYFVKGCTRDTTFRANASDALTVTSQGVIFMMQGKTNNELEQSFIGGVEVCWNDIRHDWIKLKRRAKNIPTEDYMFAGQNYMYRNMAAKTSANDYHRNHWIWNVWNNIGFAPDWQDSTGADRADWGNGSKWDRVHDNLYMLDPVSVGNKFAPPFAHLNGIIGPFARDAAADMPQTVTGGIQNVQSWGSLDSNEDVTVTLGPRGRNRLLVLVMFQNGFNARGLGAPLDGVFGTQIVTVGGQWNARILVHTLSDKMLPDDGDYVVSAQAGGTVTAFALYMEGADQTTLPLVEGHRGNGDTIVPGTVSIPGGTADQLALCLQRTETGSYTVSDGDTTYAHQHDGPRHHAMYRMGADTPIGFNEDHTGIVRALAFHPAI